MTGRTFDAAEAHSIRFVNRVVPDVQLDAKTEALAAQLARKSALVLTQTKQQVEASAPLVPDLLDGEADAAALAAAFADAESRAVAGNYRRARREST